MKKSLRSYDRRYIQIPLMMMSIRMTLFLMIILMSILGCFSVAMDSNSSGKGNNEFFDYVADERSSQNLPQKRYTYVSEFKRLPVYNFGIGKRSRPYGFGVGRRSPQNYGFGIGKRLNFDDQPFDYVPDASFDSNPKDFEENQMQYKRGSTQRFSFGVGKRESDSVSSLVEYLVNEIRKQKHNTEDLNLYDVYDLIQSHDKNKLNAVSDKRKLLLLKNEE